MAMDKSAADAYIYARSSGILASSYIGNKARELFNVRTLQELWTLVFKSEVPAVPGSILAKKLEQEATSTFIEQFKKLLCTYEKPSPVLIALLHYYDYDNLKDIGAALCFKEKDMPSIVDTSPYSLVNYSKWPNIESMTASGPLSWYDKVPSVKDQQYNDYRLDCQYIQELMSAFNKEKSSAFDELKELFIEKYQMEDVLWALRLKIFYNMDDQEILNHLAYEGKSVKGDRIAKDALKILSWPVDSYEHWKKWKHAELLNPCTDGEIWQIDPRWIASSYNGKFVEKAIRLFHLYPSTQVPLVCWYIIKQHELENICTASECIRLNASVDDAMVVAGISEVKNG